MQLESTRRKSGVPPRPLADRFWPKVNKNGPVPAHCPELGPCWLWTGTVTKAGYGLINSGKRTERGNYRPVYVHRAAYELVKGPLAPGKDACHHCDNPPCCNPAHLFEGTHKMNSDDMRAKGRGVIGEHQWGAKATDERVREIRRRYAAGGISQKTLASEYGLFQTTISQIVRRVTWRHVE